MTTIVYTRPIAKPNPDTPIINGQPYRIDDNWYKFLTDLHARTGGVSNAILSQALITQNLDTQVLNVTAGSFLNISDLGGLQIQGVSVDTSAAQFNTFDDIDSTPSDGDILIGNAGSVAYVTGSITTSGRLNITLGPGTIELDITEEEYYAVKSANYTLLTTDSFIEADTANITITLPTAVGVAGKVYNIGNTSTAGRVTIDTTSSQTLQGELQQFLLAGENYTIVSDGNNWRVV